MKREWFCRGCGSRGIVEHAADAGIYQRTAAIMRAHFAANQACELKNGCAEIASSPYGGPLIERGHGSGPLKETT
jgi:hypothetical protein